MWTYRLSSKNGDSFPEGRDLRVPIEREVHLRRIIRKCGWKVGAPVRIKKCGTEGVISEIVFNPDLVDWTGGRPHFIVVDIGGSEVLVNQSQIQRRKVK